MNAQVLHVAAAQRIDGGDAIRLEAWLDDGGRRYRVTRRQPDGLLISDFSIMGNRVIQYRPQARMVEERTYEDPHAQELGQARRHLARYRDLLALGVAQETGRNEFDGRTVLTLEVPPRRGDGQRVRATLDARTLAPLMEEVYLPKGDAYGLVSSMATEYLTWEALPAVNLPDAAFTVPVPDGIGRLVGASISLATAASLPRPIYYVGPSCQGRPIYSIELAQRAGGALQPFDGAYVTYAPRTNFWELAAVAEVRQVVTQALPSSGTPPPGAMAPGAVAVDPDGSARATLVVDGSMVAFGGRSEDEVRQMMAAVRPIR